MHGSPGPGPRPALGGQPRLTPPCWPGEGAACEEPWTGTQLQLIALSQPHLPPLHGGRIADRMLSCSAWTARRGQPKALTVPCSWKGPRRGWRHSRILTCLVQPAWRRAQECEGLWPSPAAGLTEGSWEQSRALDIVGTSSWVPRTIRPHLQPGWSGPCMSQDPEGRRGGGQL